MNPAARRASAEDLPSGFFSEASVADREYDVAVVAGARTPFARAFGRLAEVPVLELATTAVREAVARGEVPPESVDEVVVGCVAQPAEAVNLARVTALRAGLPARAVASTPHRNCASGMEAIALGARRVRDGEARVVVAGGAESMSGVPFLFSRAAARFFTSLARARGGPARLRALLRFRPRLLRPVHALQAGLTDPLCGLSMGETAELLAREARIPREEQDAFALESHRRALSARAALREEIVPVWLPARGEVVEEDEGPRADTDLEKLARLRPLYDRIHGTITAGNSCGITDGAAALVLASASWVAGRGVQPLGWVRGDVVVGLEPERMGLGPALAIPRLLDRLGWRPEEVDLWEVNEAFAAQVLAVQRALASPEFVRARLEREEPPGSLPADRLNVNGGAIALGHPVGASGARLVLTLLHELRRRGARRGVAALCVGGGQGQALAVECAA